MPSKPISRSMRFSEATYAMIEQQAGDNFSAKFEALVTKCCWELPSKKKELQQIQTQIENERFRLRKIQKKAEELNTAIYKMQTNINYVSDTVNQGIKTIKGLIEEET